MKFTNLKTKRQGILMPYIVFFLLMFVYFNWFANYIFFYQEKSSLFLVSYSSLIEALNRPGGFLNYLGQFVTTFYFYPLAGSVLVSVVLCLVVWLVAETGKIHTGKNLYVLPFIIGTALFYLQTNYQFRIFNSVGVLLQLLLFYFTITRLKRKLQWAPVFLFPAWYVLTGSFSVIFLVLFSFHLIVFKEKLFGVKFVILLLISALFLYVSNEFLFFQTTGSLLIYPFSEVHVGMQTKLFLSVVIIISTLPLLFQFRLKFVRKLQIKRINLIKLMPYLVILLTLVLSIARIDRRTKHYFNVEKLFYEQKFEEIIAFNSKNPSNNWLTNYFNNIALAETGKLNDLLFHFPQSPVGKTLFLEWDMVGEVLKRGGYFYYTIGMINEAHRWVYENMVMKGYEPEGLKMLIKTELINGNYKIASKYISILKKSFFYRKNAKEFEKLLYNENAINSNCEYGKKRKIKVTNDFFVLANEPAHNLDLILEQDSLNRMAFEYKLANLMLQKDLNKIAEQLPQLQKFGYTRIPKHLEEAAVSYKLLKIGEFPDIGTLRISKEIENQFNQYYLTFNQFGNNPQRAQHALYNKFRDTFWYYVFYN